MEEWKLTKIGSICKRVCSGGTPKSTIEEYYGGTIPWLNTKEINFNRIYNTESTITEVGLKNSSAKWIEAKSVIIAMYGATAAKCAIGMIPMTTNQACCNLMIDENKADFRYVYYAITNSYSQLASLANGGAQQNLNAQLIKDFEIPLPTLTTQKKIADILFAIDDKIELNNRINHNLEQQAQALYKSWFVDFEPFKKTGLVYSELGYIPQGWGVSEIKDIAVLNAGGDKPQLVSEKANKDCNIPIYSNGLDRKGLYGFTNELRIGVPSITITARGTIGDVQLRLSPYCPIVRLLSITPKEPTALLFLYYTLKNKTINGVGTTQQQLTIPNFQKEKIILPKNDVINSFYDSIYPIIKQMNYYEDENESLASIRNLILPEIMSKGIYIKA